MGLDLSIQSLSSSGSAGLFTALYRARTEGQDSGPNFTSRLPSRAGSRSDSSPDTHSPGGETSVKLEQDRDPATPSLAAAVLPGGPVPAQVPGAAAGVQTRDLAGTQEAARAVSPTAFEAAGGQTQALEPVEQSSESEEGQDPGGRDAAQARAARAYARTAAVAEASAPGLDQKA